MNPLKRLIPYLRHELHTLLLAYACMVVLAVTSAVYAFLAGPALKFVFTGRFSDVLRTSNGDLRGVVKGIPLDLVAKLETLDPKFALLVVPLLLVVTAFVKGASHTGQFALLGRASQNILKRLRGDAFDAMLHQSPAFFGKRAHGDLLSRLTSDANQVEQAVFNGWAPLFREPLSVLVLIGFCFYTDPKLAMFTLITVPVALLPLARFSRWLKKVSRRGQDVQGAINAVCYEALAGIRVVQSFGAEAREAKKLDLAGERYLKQMRKSYFIRAVRTPTMEFLGAIALAGLLALLGYQVQAKGADPAHFISFFVAVVLMYDPLKKLGNVSDFMATGAAAAERIFEIIDLVPEIRDAANATPIAPFQERVEFSAVGFGYGSTPVLSDVSLTLRAGQMIALVGSSGAGKTTLAHLLPRFYDVTAGGICIDGRDIREVTLASLRHQIGMVSQDNFLFNATVEENIAYGRPDASVERIRAAAKAAYADEFIDRMPQGYRTIIGERGILLSGGQRQRLAIARALLCDPPLLILDEATSALDVESERFVQQALEELMRGRTSLVIAHRLSTVRRADLIAVLKDGRIIERGRHDELLAHNGEYARLYAMQFETSSPTSRG